MSYLKQVVILAGGKGTRMKEMTSDLPKPMVPIGGMPVIDHLIRIFNTFDKFEFIVCSGYLSNIIEKHYKGIKNVKVIYTGDETQTGGRIKKIEDYLDDRFLVTYGDGLANVNINKLVNFHKDNKTIGTITATQPISRFGLIDFNKKGEVKTFIEKPKLSDFINIGFMVFEKEFTEYLNKDSILESDPLVKLAENRELFAYRHNGYFEPMDTYREYLHMNSLWESGKAPWVTIEE